MSTSIPYTHKHEDEDGVSAVPHDESHDHHVQPTHAHPAHGTHVHDAHHHPHPAHGHIVHAIQKTWWERWWWVFVSVLAVATAAGVWWSRAVETETDGKPGSAALIAQMKAASEGWVEGSNSFGGRIKSEEGNGKHAVTVTGIPNKPCVEASWALARDGQVTVNGVFLPRISAGKLAELCSSGDNNSTIIWSPK